MYVIFVNIAIPCINSRKETHPIIYRPSRNTLPLNRQSNILYLLPPNVLLIIAHSNSLSLAVYMLYSPCYFYIRASLKIPDRSQTRHVASGDTMAYTNDVTYPLSSSLFHLPTSRGCIRSDVIRKMHRSQMNNVREANAQCEAFRGKSWTIWATAREKTKSLEIALSKPPPPIDRQSFSVKRVSVSLCLWVVCVKRMHFLEKLRCVMSSLTYPIYMVFAGSCNKYGTLFVFVRNRICRVASELNQLCAWNMLKWFKLLAISFKFGFCFSMYR